MRLTVGICAHNEEKNIDFLLNNILREQNIPPDSEILVVCSGCTDDTVKIVQNHSKTDLRVEAYVENERLGKASAINYILANAKGNFILFLSADTLPQKNCFSNLISKLSDPKVGLVCGKPLPVNESKSLADNLVRTLWQSHDYVFKKLSQAGLARHASEIFIVRSGIIKKIPTQTINDDALIALIAKKKGWLVQYDENSRVSICGPKTLSDYIKQRRRVLVGHWQIKKSTGDSPQHLAYLLPIYPRQVLELVLGLCKEEGLVNLAIFATIEVIINLSVIPNLFTRQLSNKWSVVSSTKTVILPNVDLPNPLLLCFKLLKCAMNKQVLWSKCSSA